MLRVKKYGTLVISINLDNDQWSGSDIADFSFVNKTKFLRSRPK